MKELIEKDILEINADQSRVNKIFALFHVAYPSQYGKLYPDDKELKLAKRLWLKYLDGHSDSFVFKAIDRAIKKSKYIPNIADVFDVTNEPWVLIQSAPTANKAYKEACQAPHPQIEHQWSHPLVYYTGSNVGWSFLASNSSHKSLPVFKEEYKTKCMAFLESGAESLAMPDKEPPKEIEQISYSKEDSLKALKELRESIGI